MNCHRWVVGSLCCLIAVSGFAFATMPSKKSAAPLKICMLSGSFEYNSHDSLTKFKKYLEDHYNVQCTLLKAPEDKKDLPGLEALDDCDVALFFTRRMLIDGERLEQVKKYCLSGRPIVAVRTASHGFQNWLEFDKLILGGNYHNHYPDGPETTATVVAAAAHPVLEGVPTTLKSPGSLYKTSPLADDCTLLMTGTRPGQEPEPLAWTRTYKGARIFYTSLGHPKDFETAGFRRLITNALFWAAKRKVERKD
jgi:type 1 glutamine amidotransferase